MISIIIPTYNESDTIGPLINYLFEKGGSIINEIIVADGGSQDRTCDFAKNAGATVLRSPQKGRAVQMNYGASQANGSVLYFVHADSFPPSSFGSDMLAALEQGFEFGRYRTKFDSHHWILKINAFFTRFDLFICSGGDQTLFITGALFRKLGGFTNSMLIMEDYDIVTRGKAVADYKIIQKDTLVSARKYDSNSWLTVQLANFKIVRMYKKGASQGEMAERYKQLLNYR